jgi:hypothetical protein
MGDMEWTQHKNFQAYERHAYHDTIIFDRNCIKSEARTWVLAGAKYLGIFIAGE